MNGEPLRRSIVVTNPQGLHMRPITSFVQVAKTFQSDVEIVKNGERFNGKSPLTLMGLGAVQGTELVLEVRGQDQDAAMKSLGDLLNELAAHEPPAAQESPAAPGGGN